MKILSDLYLFISAYLQRTDEGLILQNDVAANDAIQTIEMMFGPFDDEEVAFYKRRFSDGTKCVINSFQRDLVLNLFMKYFGDVSTTNCINFESYIKLIIAARRILETSGMILLPYIISSKVLRLATRKNINKKEFTKLESSRIWSMIKDKYRNEKIEKHILGLIAVILSSDFEIIDPDDPELDGQKIVVVPELISEEILMYISII